MVRRGHPVGRGPLATRGPHSKRCVVVEESPPASLGCLVPVVHDLAFARTAGTLVQVAASPHSDECEAGAARRALYSRRERVKPHGKLWHLFIPSPRASRGMRDSISHRSIRRAGLGCGGRRGARHRFGSGDPCATTDNRLLARCSLVVQLVKGTRASASLPLRLGLSLASFKECINHAPLDSPTAANLDGWQLPLAQ